MKDYIAIGKCLQLSKYDRHTKLSDFKDKSFYIISATSIHGSDKEGYTIEIEDVDGIKQTIKTFSKTIVAEIKDLLLYQPNDSGVFKIPIKATLQVTPFKVGNTYHERFKLI